jgi:hypothetical protein
VERGRSEPRACRVCRGEDLEGKLPLPFHCRFLCPLSIVIFFWGFFLVSLIA